MNAFNNAWASVPERVIAADEVLPKLVQEKNWDEIKMMLKTLGRMDVDVSMLTSCGIGRTVNKLKKAEDGDVQTLAKAVVRKWKDMVNAQELEGACPVPQQPLRDDSNAACPGPAPAKTPRGEVAERAAAAAPTRPTEALVPVAEILALVSGRDAVGAAALEALVAHSRRGASAAPTVRRGAPDEAPAAAPDAPATPAPVASKRRHAPPTKPIPKKMKSTAPPPPPAQVGDHGPQSFEEFDLVDAYFRPWQGWFPARVESQWEDGSYDVLYDDGEFEVGVPAELLRARKRR